MTEILIVGSFCHDTLLHTHGRYETLGGSSAYISRAVGAKGISHSVVSKVGIDFRFHETAPARPIVSDRFPTTHFLADLTGSIRRFVLEGRCEPIYPKDLPSGRFRIGIACGVAMELLPETLSALRERVDFLVCDAQSLIRDADGDGKVIHRAISATGFRDLLPLIDLLKANREEAEFLGQRPGCPLIITEGAAGARFLRGDGGEVRIPSPPAAEVDPTGAGDAFIAGLSVGLCSGMPLLDAAKLGGQYGSFAVQSVGIPDFSLFFPV